MPAFSWDTAGLRKCSEVRDVLFPWKSASVALIHVSVAEPTRGTVRYARTIGDKRALLDGLQKGDCLLAAWPGQYKQDIFVVDDLKAARAGLLPHAP